MKRIKKILFCGIIVSLSAFIFADNENYYQKNFDGRDFSGRSFKNSKWSTCSINETNFSGAILDASEFQGAKAVGSIFDGASFVGASISGDFSNASFINANFDNGENDGYISTTAINANFNGANLQNLNTIGGDFSGASFVGAKISVHNYTNFTAIGAIFDEAVIATSGVGLDGDFSYASFKGTDFTGTRSLRGNFSNANFENANLEDVTFTHYANFTNVDFTSAKLGENCFITGILDGANFSGQKLGGVSGNGSTNVDFSGATINSIHSVSNSNLSNVKVNGGSGLSVSNVTNSNFSNADLSGVTISYVEGSDFSDANIQGAEIYIGFSKEQIYQTKNYKLNNEECNLSDIKFYHTIGDHIPYDFYEVNFENKILRRTQFGGAGPELAISVIFKKASFKGADLSSAGFSCVAGNSTVFDMAILKNSRYYYSDFSGSTFRNAIMTDVSFFDVNLTGSDFTNAILSGATFSETKIDGAVIKGADLSSTVQNGFTEEHLYSTASYKDKDLSGVWFDYNNISGWDLSGQNLQNASFFASRLTNTDMSGSDLRGAEMTAISGSPVYKNTIMSDGLIKNFSMTSTADSFSIRKYEPATEGGAMISAKLGESSTISGGAVLTLESGAEFELANNAVLTVDADSGIVINASSENPPAFIVGDGAGLDFLADSILEVNLELDPLEDFNATLSFDVIEFAGAARISGFENLKKGENFTLKVNGETFGGEWDFILGDDALTVVLGAVPEPAACAAVFAVFALGCAALRRRPSAA